MRKPGKVEDTITYINKLKYITVEKKNSQIGVTTSMRIKQKHRGEPNTNKKNMYLRKYVNEVSIESKTLENEEKRVN